MTRKTMSKKSKKMLMDEIANEVSALVDSPLYQYRVDNSYLPVVGDGDLDSDIVMIGEAPGLNEAVRGKPFVGRAGNVLDSLLLSASILREDIYITNIVKDRPPANRDPLPFEIELYSVFLDRQIEIIKPKVIATLGRLSMKYIMTRYGLGEFIKPINEIHGRRFVIHFKYGEVLFVPLFHPAVCLYDPRKKQVLVDDMKLLRKMIERSNS
jgi:uracil-DNA glycosylase